MNKVEEKITKSISELLKEKYDFLINHEEINFEIPKDNSKGDYASNVAMRLAKELKKKPIDIATEIKERLINLEEIESIDIAGPGFINFWMKKDALSSIINTILEEGNEFGISKDKHLEKYLVEYVSANPTGILHCGNARGAAYGDSIYRILKANGYDVTREYYINDAGNQIHNLGVSIYERYKGLFGLDYQIPEDGYAGEDITQIANEIKDVDNDKWLNIDPNEAIDAFAQIGKEKELKRIKEDLEYFNCEFDSWISEKSLYDNGKVEEVIKLMKEKNLIYEKENALWFKSSEYGDEKDRVLLKSDGSYTYMTPDIANHINKFERGYDILVNVWGADHHGYVARVKAAMKALGYNSDNLRVDLCQMVRMIENGVEVKMSKRTGNALTIRELIDDIGVDAARYFYISKALDSHLDFDLNIARSKSNDNPVYYIQYAHARISSLIKQANLNINTNSFDKLTNSKESDILKQLADYPNVVKDAGETRSPNKICNYIYKLASLFHSYYGANKIVDKEDEELSIQRLALAKAVGIILANGLSLLGVNAPESM